MKIHIPGALWVALIVGIIPVVQQVIAQFYPESSYPLTAVVVTGLGVLAKSVQVATQGNGQQPAIDDTINSDGAPLPAAAPAPVRQPAGWQQILWG